MIKKIIITASFWLLSIAAFAYESTGIAGVDETTGYGKKIAYALLFLGGVACVIGGAWKLGSEQKSGKIVGGTLIGIGVIAWGILGLWVSKMSGFSF